MQAPAMKSWLRLLAALPLALAFACDTGTEGKDLEAAAAAALGTEKDKETKEREEKEAAERRKAFEERKKQEDEVAAKLDKFTAALVAVPDKLPKDLDAACTELIEVYSEWIKAIYFDDDAKQLTFFDSKSKNLGEIKGNCAKVGNIEAAACMTHVIRGVSAEDFLESDRKIIQSKPDHFFDACVTKYAGK
ncbi:hypothetical protein ACNOYE_34145 [Nannocystaceae bacterium ST9]